MLNKKQLIEKRPDLAEMFKQINIPDFYKCIAQYAGIEIQNLQDEVIEQYLITWATQKQHIFKFFGNQIKVDIPIIYKDELTDYENKIMEIAHDFPVYYHWLHMFRDMKTNKIDASYYFSYSEKQAIENLCPGYNYIGTTLTHFFKNKLNAPDELVTALGRIWENTEVSATFTLSIDPVDIMLSSENPYNWTSCYRLEGDGFESSHADGCLAGVLDSATIITYIWNSEGKFTLYNKYIFKNIRYKKMRMTIATNKEFNAIHFNAIYPGKSDLSDDFQKLLRTTVEDYFAKQLNVDSKWSRNNEYKIRCSREHWEYGYDEYSADRVYLLSNASSYSNITPYDSVIYCPCGCGEKYIGTEGCENQNCEYNGYGHTNDNYSDCGVYCEEIDEYIDCDQDCSHCANWNRNHLVCSLDENEPCDQYYYELECGDYVDTENSNVVRCGEHCEGCPLYEQHHSGSDPNEADAAYEENKLNENQ